MELKKIENIVERHFPILFGNSVYAQILSADVRVVSRHAPSLGNSLSPSYFTSSNKRGLPGLALKVITSVESA